MNKVCFLFVFAAFILVGILALNVIAHPPFPDYVEHHVSIVLSPNYIDATVRFTFHQKEALAVRRRIDENHDKTLTTDEYEAFLGRIANQHEWLTLQVNDEPLNMVVLYDPAFDEFGNDQVNQTMFVCEFSFFSQTPPIDNVNTLRIDDSFMPQTPAVCVLSATAISGAPLRDATASGAMSGPLPLRIASPDVGSASRVFTLALTKDHFAGEKP
ncbi:MAG: hypothetical protein P9L94_00870 [Candidatus Hinthialibacter antarcticus]|nr:hypothetical protein [Candidatus Hinthialibacter antarcticus]